MKDLIPCPGYERVMLQHPEVSEDDVRRCELSEGREVSVMVTVDN